MAYLKYNERKMPRLIVVVIRTSNLSHRAWKKIDGRTQSIDRIVTGHPICSWIGSPQVEHVVGRRPVSLNLPNMDLAGFPQCGQRRDEFIWNA